MIFIQIILGAALIFSIAYAVVIIRLKWHMKKNPPYSFEKEGDYITDAYFERMQREVRDFW